MKLTTSSFIKILMLIFFIITIIVEIFMLIGCLITVKYNIEMTDNINKAVGFIYMIIDTLGAIIIFDLVYLLVLHLLFFKKKSSTTP
ncbi:hypothetical protein A9G13_06750 [Gilliamella sp. wkB178]|uniref:hypothetical protein n=1 Tax=Gilliamella sp. wkB178 TaxID=3120259 RepID=UPI00080E90A6|nr:hypothetical protein [Gilliamella apicola]OCG07901.1 hypothetical protein A9G13_06750 [Gilliamella apicola]